METLFRVPLNIKNLFFTIFWQILKENQTKKYLPLKKLKKKGKEVFEKRLKMWKQT